MRRMLNCQKKQKKMRGKIDSTRNKTLKAKKKKERNKILNEIKELLKKEKENITEHTNVSKCFEAVRLLKRKKP